MLCAESELSVYVATFNVNGNYPDGIDLSKLLCECENPPDIYAIGFQELSQTRCLVELLQRSLHPSASYEMYDAVQIKSSILLVVAVKKSITSRIRLKSTDAKTRHSIRPKGAVGFSLLLDSVNICFINAHFYAHTKNVAERQDDHDHTFETIHFQHRSLDLRIDEHDVVFFFGDLNYRLNTPNQDIRNSTDYSSLIQYDQLRNEMRLGNVFANFSEGPLAFIPTFKYDPGTNNWDSCVGRDPAWCDRILWKGNRVIQLAYQSVMDIKLSDHKPVYSVFRIQNELQSSRSDASTRVQVTLNKRIVSFPMMKFYETHEKCLCISNRHKTKVSIRLSVQQRCTKFFENWLEIEPKEAVLVPGGFLEVRLRVQIDSSSACVLQSKTAQGGVRRKILFGKMVIEQAEHADQLVDILGSYTSNVFGHSLEYLIQRPHCLDSSSLVPKEIIILVKYLYEHGLRVRDLFVDSDSHRIYRGHTEVKRICSHLEQNSGQDLLVDSDPRAVAETLITLLESSPEPLVDPEEAEPSMQIDFLWRMSAVNEAVLRYIYHFLKAYTMNKPHNKCDLGRTAILFGGVLLKEHPARIGNRRVGPRHDNNRTMFVMEMLSEKLQALFGKEQVNQR